MNHTLNTTVPLWLWVTIAAFAVLTTAMFMWDHKTKGKNK